MPFLPKALKYCLHSHRGTVALPEVDGPVAVSVECSEVMLEGFM
jgi:hypothetical protein